MAFCYGAPRMPELRRDPVVDRWVIIAPERADRPNALIRDFQLQHELINNNDSVLAEEAMTIRRVWAPTEWKVAA